MEIDIGIDQEHRQKIADGLSRLLADSYTLYLKTHTHSEYNRALQLHGTNVDNLV